MGNIGFVEEEGLSQINNLDPVEKVCKVICIFNAQALQLYQKIFVVVRM